MAEQPFPQEEQPAIDPADVAQAASLENHVVEPTSIEVQTDDATQTADENEGRWDHDKAETIAAAQKQEGSKFDTAFKDYDNRIESIEGQAPSYTARAKRWVEDSEQLLPGKRAALESKNSIRSVEDRKKHLEDAEKDLEAAKESLSIAEDQAQEFVDRSTSDARRDRNRKIDDESSRLEDLYDLNPDRFANMPTSEFMGVAKELRKLDADIDYHNDSLGQVKVYVEEVDKFTEQERELTPAAVHEAFERFVSLVWDNPGKPGADYEEFYDKEEKQYYEPIYEGSFDKSPREKMNSIKAMYEKYAARIQEKRDSAQAQRDEVVAKYTPAADQKES